MRTKGGKGSGFFGHTGRPGEIGGSSSGLSARTEKPSFIENNPSYNPELFDIQNEKIEQLPKRVSNRAVGLRLENAGDVLRELLSRQEPAVSYISEKIDRIRGELRYPDELRQRLSSSDQELVNETKRLYGEMPLVSEHAMRAREVIYAIADQDISRIGKSLDAFELSIWGEAFKNAVQDSSIVEWFLSTNDDIYAGEITINNEDDDDWMKSLPGYKNEIDIHDNLSAERKYGKTDAKEFILNRLKGGPGSGFFGHAGRPGEVGGSASRAVRGKIPFERATSRAGYKTAREIREKLLKSTTSQEKLLIGVEQDIRNVSNEIKGLRKGDKPSMENLLELTNEKAALEKTRAEIKNRIRASTLRVLSGMMPEKKAEITPEFVENTERGEKFGEIKNETMRKEISRVLGDISSFTSATLFENGKVVAKVANSDWRPLVDSSTGIMHIPDSYDVNKIRRFVSHEIGHIFEAANPLLKYNNLAFREKRTEGEDAYVLNPSYPQERVKRDKFIDPYMGRIYPANVGTEILSCGIEQLVSNPLRFARQDPESFDFVVSTLLDIPME